jgi:hypothetical protein
MLARFFVFPYRLCVKLYAAVHIYIHGFVLKLYFTQEVLFSAVIVKFPTDRAAETLQVLA